MTFTFHGDELDVVPADWPKKMPPGAKGLCGAEWAFSPASSRIDEYKGWASKKLGRVFVWWRGAEMADFAPVRFRPYASGPFNGEEADSFAQCLRFGWETERSGFELTRPDQIAPNFLDQALLDRMLASIWASPRPAAERNLFLDFYDVEGGLRTKWSWKDRDTNESSQEFDSEEEALEAMRQERLEWSRIEDFGA